MGKKTERGGRKKINCYDKPIYMITQGGAPKNSHVLEELYRNQTCNMQAKSVVIALDSNAC